MPTAYLSLGSNLGDRAENLRNALTRIETTQVRLTGVSSLYETAPVGETATPVPMYLNQVAAIETDLAPSDVLDHLQEVERIGGRIRTTRWAARTIDIDLLLYDDVTVESERLTVPHPRIYERAFVLLPLAEIAPGLRFPDGTTVEERLASPTVQDQIERNEVQRLTP